MRIKWDNTGKVLPWWLGYIKCSINDGFKKKKYSHTLTVYDLERNENKSLLWPACFTQTGTRPPRGWRGPHTQQQYSLRTVLGRHCARLTFVLLEGQFPKLGKSFWLKFKLKSVSLPHCLSHLVNPQETSLGNPTFNVKVGVSAPHHLYYYTRRQANPLSMILWGRGGGGCLFIF